MAAEPPQAGAYTSLREKDRSRLAISMPQARRIASRRPPIMNTRRLRRIALLAIFSLAMAGAAPDLSAQQQTSRQEHRKMPGENPGQNQTMPGMDSEVPGMNMGQGANGKDAQAERGAMDAMSHMHHHQMGPHMYMTRLRTPTPQDWARADEIVKRLRESIVKYKDYRVALADGFHIFMPNVPQQEYHFTNYFNAYLETFTYDPARPTSLLYKKTKTGYELIGAMYTMPKRVSEEQLNQRVPLSIAQWHLHVRLCMPPRGQYARANLKKFGFEGSITTRKACAEAGGTYYPVIFGWMVHVYPFEDSREKIWTQ